MDEYKEVMRRFFDGEETGFDEEIKRQYDKADELTRKLIDYRLNGGNYQNVTAEFFISQETFYRRLRRFFMKVLRRRLTKK